MYKENILTYLKSITDDDGGLEGGSPRFCLVPSTLRYRGEHTYGAGTILTPFECHLGHKIRVLI